MSAIKTLQQNAKSQNVTNVVDLSIRHLLAKALKDSGKFNEVNSKMDSRRGSLSVKVSGTYNVRKVDVLEQIAAKAGLTIRVRVTSSSFSDTTFKVEQLVQKSNAIAAPTATAVPATKTLATSLTKTMPTVSNRVGSILVVVAGVSQGYVSDEAAAKIRAIVVEDQRPKTVDMVFVNLNKNASETVTLPYGVGEAVKGKVPSYTAQEWTVKSTQGIVSVRNTKTGGHWVLI